MSVAVGHIDGIVLKKKRGVVKGSRHSGMFQKGTGANRDARICTQPHKAGAVIAKAQEIASEHLEDALHFLVAVMNDPSQPVKARIDCSIHLLSRSVGTPVSMSVHKDLTEEGGESKQEALKSLSGGATPATLTDEELLQIIQSSLPPTEEIIEANVNAVTVEQDTTND